MRDEIPAHQAQNADSVALATNGYIGVRSLELWITDAGLTRNLHATLLGDPNKPINGQPPWVRVEFSEADHPLEPIIAPEVGSVDEALSSSMCGAQNPGPRTSSLD